MGDILKFGHHRTRTPEQVRRRTVRRRYKTVWRLVDDLRRSAKGSRSGRQAVEVARLMRLVAVEERRNMWVPLRRTRQIVSGLPNSTVAGWVVWLTGKLRSVGVDWREALRQIARLVLANRAWLDGGILLAPVKDVVLEDEDGDMHDLGDFTVSISLVRASEGLAAVKVMVAGGNTSSRSGYFHPHVSSDGGLCAGDSAAVLSRLIREFRMEEAVDMIEACLRSYEPDGAYERLEVWRHVACPGCGDPMAEECSRCGGEVCPTCAPNCYVCGVPSDLCERCRESGCPECGEWAHISCLEECAACGAVIRECCGLNEIQTCESCDGAGCTICTYECRLCGREECAVCRGSCGTTLIGEFLPDSDRVRTPMGAVDVHDGTVRPGHPGQRWNAGRAEWEAVGQMML